MVGSARAKGSRNEKRCMELLESDGWLVDRVEKKGKFLKNKDLFGLFDLVAMKGNITKFIQVTTNSPHVHGNYDSFAKQWEHSMRQIEQYVHYDRKGWVIFKYYKSFSKKKEDLRK